MSDKLYEVVTNEQGDLLWSGENLKGNWPAPGQTFERNGQTFVVMSSAYTKGRAGGFGRHSSAFLELTVTLASGDVPFPAPQEDLQAIVRIFDGETFAAIDAMIAQKVAAHFQRLADTALLSGSASIGGPEFVRQQERRAQYEASGFTLASHMGSTE